MKTLVILSKAKNLNQKTLRYAQGDSTKERRSISMFGKISGAFTPLYRKTADFVREFRKDERGLSGVVVAILLILVAVLAIVLIWGFLSGWLQDLWDQIVGEAGTI